MGLKVPDITITSLETITAFDLLTGAYKFTLDELQNATISNTQEKEDITGKQGRKLSSLKRNKAVKISGTNGLISGGLLEVQVGSEFEKKASTPVKYPDYLTVMGNKATTSFIAVGTTGNEIGEVIVKDEAGLAVKTLTQDATASAGKFAYNPESKELSFFEGDIEDGAEIIIHYMRNIEGYVLSNISDNYSEKSELFVDAFGEDKCGKVYRVQFHLPKADFEGNFDLTLGDSQTVHAFEAESLAGACTTGGALWSYTIFGVDAEDIGA